MIHLYTTRIYIRSYGSQPERFKRLCDKEWVDDLETTVNRHGTRAPKNFTTVPHLVTCKKCLDILIPKKQRELDQMKSARELGL